MFFFPSPFLYYDLSFDMQKPSHITNVHWKFHDFFPSSLGAIKVLHFTVRSKDGVIDERIVEEHFHNSFSFWKANTDHLTRLDFY